MRLPLPHDRCLRPGTRVSRGFGLPLLLTVSSLMGPLEGCANTGSIADPDPESKHITLACQNNLTEDTSLLDWELTVRPTQIESGEPFAADLDGVAVFDEAFLDAAQNLPDLIPGGVREVNLVDLNATVEVRLGATGPDVSLEVDPIPYKCSIGRTECDPANDVPGGGNTECQPENDLNPCGRFIGLPTSDDCDPGGVCAELGKEGQCSDNGFCITGDLLLELDGGLGGYTADSEGEVLFGWWENGSIEERPKFTDMTGPIGLRLGAGPFPVALECVMRDTTPDIDLICFKIDAPDTPCDPP